ncbi:Ig-like domain repeat protein, partial [Salinispora arenicola]|uniref:Ig-like domain repeat protein n=1 Tax=Salinispora arenicola TaxID=168697 RepID=UPI003555E62D|nr:cell wall anchor protein [Salinispora arenicola]
FHSLAIVPPTSTTTLQVSPPDPTLNQDVTLTATVTCNIDTPTGTITFRNNNTDLATVPLDSNNTATHTTDPDLPITGPNLPTTIGTATLLILTGAALVHLTRRHRPTHHPH